MDKNTIQKSALIHIRDRKILMTRSVGKDVFYMPGGKPEAGESAMDALIREIKEEANIDLDRDTIKFLNTYIAQAHGKPEGVMVHMECFEAEFKGELKATGEIEEIKYLTYKDRDIVGGVAKVIFDDLKERNMID